MYTGNPPNPVEVITEGERFRMDSGRKIGQTPALVPQPTAAK